MQALNVLFNSDAGQYSLVALAITLGIGAFYLRYFLKHIKEDTARAAREQQ